MIRRLPSRLPAALLAGVLLLPNGAILDATARFSGADAEASSASDTGDPPVGKPPLTEPSEIEVSRLIVRYRQGANLTESPGVATGSDQLPSMKLLPGRLVGFGLRTVLLPAAVSLAEAQKLADAVALDPDVLDAVPDVPISFADSIEPAEVQSDAPWGIDRIDQRGLPLDGSYSFGTTGAGVTVYVVDSGIRTDHGEFAGRISGGYSAVSDGRGLLDGVGHGTHVAGTIAGTTHGVAKGATIVPVKVFDYSGAGTSSTLIAGLNWIVAHHAEGTPAVANLSLGASGSFAIDTAVRAVIDDGVTVVVASGNDASNACYYSPARVPEAITVNASTDTDDDASFSNYGACSDLYAPGEDITSAWHTGTSATATISGTSMAAPHVAGAAARFLSVNPSASPSVVADAILSASTSVDFGLGSTGDPNRLLYVSPTTDAALELSPAPTPSISGTPLVGRVLTAIPGTWGPAPVTLRYQWQRDGSPIVGATSVTYTVTSADLGRSITASVTGSRSGYPSVTRVSRGVTISSGNAFSLLSEPGALTLPDEDGLRDSITVMINSAVATTTRITLERAGSAVAVLAESRRVDGGAEVGTSIDVPLSSIAGATAGEYTLVVADLETPTVPSLRVPLMVGSGIASSVTVTPADSQLYPYADGQGDLLSATVVVSDETGLGLPASGVLAVSSGGTTRSQSVTVASGGSSAAIDITGMPLGEGTVSVTLTATTGGGAVSSPAVPLSFLPTAVQSASIALSATTVYPVRDGYRDSVVITTDLLAPDVPFEFPVSGKVTVRAGSKVVASWNLSELGSTSVTWSGRRGSKLVPGTYSVVVTARGPEGATITRTATLRVSSARLVTVKKSTTYRASSVFTSVLANNGGRCWLSGSSVTCDAYGPSASLSLFMTGQVSVPSAVRNATQFAAPRVRVTVKTSRLLRYVSGDTAFGFVQTDAATQGVELRVGSRTTPWSTISPGESSYGVSMGTYGYPTITISSVTVHYEYKVLR